MIIHSTHDFTILPETRVHLHEDACTIELVTGANALAKYFGKFENVADSACQIFSPNNFPVVTWSDGKIFIIHKIDVNFCDIDLKLVIRLHYHPKTKKLKSVKKLTLQ
tara:strand:- start:2320 stop:2643 length:324 start_codon:yes stop_codon:yes gene_type:complete